VKKQSEILAEQMRALQAEVKLIEEKEDASEDEIARSNACMDEFTDLKTRYDAAIEREAKVDEVMRAHMAAPAADRGGYGVENGANGRRSPEFQKSTDPYETFEELKRSLWTGGAFNEGDAISRANFAIDAAPKHVVTDDAKARMHHLVELDNRHAPLIARHMLLTGSEEYHEQFREYVQTRGTYVGELLRTAMSLTQSNGGYLVPFTLDPTIILTNAGIAGPIRSISTIKTIATTTWEGVTSSGVSAEWVGEGVEATDASPTFAQPTITPKRADAWVFGSYEVLADSGFANELARLLADAKVRLEEAAFATANTGATRPRGVVAAVAAVTNSLVASQTPNAYTVNDAYAVSDALRPRDAAQASWIANKKIFSLTRRFDTAGGSSFWANLGMGIPQQLIGQPTYECSSMTSVVSTGANILLAGNFKEYYIIDRVGMSVVYDPLVRSTGNGRPTGQAGWFAFWRVGADVVDPDAFRMLQLNNPVANTPLG
jgi:HK97 family phage major capsid protein